MTTVTHAWFFADGAHHRRAADVDRVDARPFEERIEVRDDEVEGLDPVALEVGEVGVLAAVGEEPAVDLRVQRLHPLVEHLGHPGDGLDPRDRQPGRFERGRGARRRHQLDTEVVRAARELGEVRSCRTPRAAPA